MKQIGKGPEAFCFRAFQFHDVVQRLALRRLVEHKKRTAESFRQFFYLLPYAFHKALDGWCEKEQDDT